MRIEDEILEELEKNRYVFRKYIEDLGAKGQKSYSHFNRTIRRHDNIKRQFIRKNRLATPVMFLSKGDEIEIHSSECKYTNLEVFHFLCEKECELYGKCNTTERFKRLNLYKDKSSIEIKGD